VPPRCPKEQLDLYARRTTMRSKTDDRHRGVEVPKELAHRAADGVDVLLLWSRDNDLRIVVDDVRTGESFELSAGNGRQALDFFYHPFAYAASGNHRSAAEVAHPVG
jgi:hypothetical protein